MSPDSPELADLAAGWRSAYVHIPFCARICPYCDFAVVAGRDETFDAYLEALLTEIRSEQAWPDLDAVYIGGGTPSRFGASRLNSIVEALGDRFGLAEDAEVSLEANPEDRDRGLAEDLRAGGFNRVSFGAQSFDGDVLEYLGRAHGPDDVSAAVESARAAGFESVNVDLIFGSPGENGWDRTVGAAVALEPDHLSLYALTVERGTALSRSISAGAAAPDPDDQADKWEWADALVAGAGFVRYEVSNFAKVGHHCRYNLSVWARGEYLGFGNGAHSFRDGLRRRNVRRLEAYLERVGSGVGPIQGAEEVTGWAGEVERVMIGLRRTAGVADGPAVQRLLQSDEGKRLVEAGVLVQGERLVVGRPLLTDMAVRAVIDLQPPEGWLSVSTPER